MKKHSLLFLLLILSVFNLYSQNIKGVVVDKKTNLPLESVAIYFNNTTKGTLTNKEGVFTIECIKNLKTPLIISYLGYKTITFKDYKPDTTYNFVLEEEYSELDEVVLLPNKKNNPLDNRDWTRLKKLRYFKQQFLGTTKNGRSCVILNEDEIKIEFSEETGNLIASSKVPLIIENEKLNYNIEYNLEDFIIHLVKDDVRVINAQRTDTLYRISSVFFNGTTFFKEIKEITKSSKANKIKAERLKTYKGSSLHFLRSVANKSLTKEKFAIYSNKVKVKPEDYIFLKKTRFSNRVEVKLLNQLQIRYNKRERSSISQLTEFFEIDASGNYTPVRSIVFGGKMGADRLGDTLPIDFQPN